MPGCLAGTHTPTPSATGHMTIGKLDAFIQRSSQRVAREGAVWKFMLEDVGVTCIADEKADRMRFVAAVIPLVKMTGEQLQRAMQANFHSAVDGRYAVRGGVLYAVYIHPLSALSVHQLRSGLYQVINLVKTFGTTYQSGGLQMLPPDQKPPPIPAPTPRKPSDDA